MIKRSELAAVFLAALATLLFEIVVTKIFEYSVWANYAYLVISTAMFGLGFSGVVLTRWPRLLNIPDVRFTTTCAIGTAATIVTAFLVLNSVPVQLPDAPDGWTMEMLRVGAVFIALSIPFMLFGLIIGYLLHHRAAAANVYYFADLLGAGLGAMLLVPLIPTLEPAGIVALCALASLAAACLFGLGSGRRAWFAAGLAVCVGASVFLVPLAREKVAIAVHVGKRHYRSDLRRGRIEASAWSALSRVDIASFLPRAKKVWIAGGVNESLIRQFDGDFDRLRARREQTLENAQRSLDHLALPHLFFSNHVVCIIGTSGGFDAYGALSYGADKVVGIEMDPQIARFVTEDYRDWAGGLFTDGRHSELIVDEGRSYLRRSGRTFDVIQQVNNFTPIAFQNGALNLSETYLLTVESFRDFYNHLTDDGLIAITRWGAVRVLSVAVEMFRQMGLPPEEYARHLVVCQGSTDVLNTCLVKKSAFTEQEIDRLFAHYRENRGPRRVLYAPYRTSDLPGLKENRNLYYLLATAPDPKPYWRMGCFNFSPPTDEKPFFNHFQILGVKDTRREELTLVPAEVTRVVAISKVGRRVPKGDLPPLIVLFEALLLSTVFFGIPLLSTPELRASLRKERRALGYFACLGAGFIFIEICLIHRLVLFLGAPVYSIALVLGVLLVFAGLGSLASGRLPPTRASLNVLLPVVALALVILDWTIPHLTRVFLGGSFPVRVLVAGFISAVAGFLMGMPMPTGIRYLRATGRNIIPWAWSINGYFTVVGTALSTLLAVNFGFPAVFYLAALLYVLAPLFLRTKA
jgi:hypothetical protein